MQYVLSISFSFLITIIHFYDLCQFVNFSDHLSLFEVCHNNLLMNLSSILSICNKYLVHIFLYADYLM